MVKKKEENFITSKEFMKKLNEPIPWYEEIYYKIYRSFHKIKEIPREIKWFIQRGRRGYADCDVWNLSSYLEGWLPQALRHLKINNIGCPFNLYDKKNKDNECHKWNDILEEMAQGFEARTSLSNLEFMDDKNVIHEDQQKKLEEKAKRGMELFVKYFDNLWD